jgi:acyl-CoA thioesterase-1
MSRPVPAAASIQIPAQSFPVRILPKHSPAGRITCLALKLAILLLLPCCSGHHEAVANLDSSGTAVVCFGDSITAGYGVRPEQAFPALIANRLDLPVINAGLDGDRTQDALARLERDVLANDPRVVVVEFGGNDFRKKVDKRETFRNLDRIVGRISRHGAMVILLEMRIGILRDEYLEGYKEVAKTHGTLLITNFMSGILGNPKLTVDGIHPNAEGHELIARRVMEELVSLLEEAERIRAGKREMP